MKQAWEAVKGATVANCYRHCGLQPTVAAIEPTETPFADLDEEEAELENLIDQIDSNDHMTATEYANANNEVATCATFEVSENWRQELREVVVSDSHQSKRFDVAGDEFEDNEADEEPPTNAITTYTEAIKHGNDMLTFLQDRGEEELANSMLKIVQKAEHAKLKYSRQNHFYITLLVSKTCFCQVHVIYSGFTNSTPD